MRGEDDLSIFVAAFLDSPSLPDLSIDISAYSTVFAPVNSAFAMLEEAFLSRIFTPSWSFHLQNLLTFHITDGALSREDLLESETIQMRNGEVIDVESNDDDDEISVCSLTQCSLLGRVLAQPGGVVHKIDAVLLPDYLNAGIETLGSRTENVTIFMDLFARASFDSDGQRSSVSTFLVPNDDAFLALGNETLEYLFDPAHVEDLSFLIAYHVLNQVYPSSLLEDGDSFLSSGNLRIGVTRSDHGALAFSGATVQTADILLRDGIAHVIDRVLGAPPTDGPVIAPPPTPPQEPASAASRCQIWGSMTLLALLSVVLLREHVLW